MKHIKQSINYLKESAQKDARRMQTSCQTAARLMNGANQKCEKIRNKQEGTKKWSLSFLRYALRISFARVSYDHTQLNGYNIVNDVNSGAIHVWTIAFAVVNLLRSLFFAPKPDWFRQSSAQFTKEEYSRL
jgi:hypothetical protein